MNAPTRASSESADGLIAKLAPPMHRPLVVLALLTALLGALHHADHIVRANHVGWPLTSDVTPFTFSLLVSTRSSSAARGSRYAEASRRGTG